MDFMFLMLAAYQGYELILKQGLVSTPQRYVEQDLSMGGWEGI